MEKIKHWLGFAGSVAFALLIAFAVAKIVNTPSYEVHKSNMSGECVRVIKHQSGKNSQVLSCASMPERYDLVWVQ